MILLASSMLMSICVFPSSYQLLPIVVLIFMATTDGKMRERAIFVENIMQVSEKSSIRLPGTTPPVARVAWQYRT